MYIGYDAKGFALPGIKAHSLPAIHDTFVLETNNPSVIFIVMKKLYMKNALWYGNGKF